MNRLKTEPAVFWFCRFSLISDGSIFPDYFDLYLMMLYRSVKLNEWINWWILSKVIDQKPKVGQRGRRRHRRRRQRQRQRSLRDMTPMCRPCFAGNTNSGYNYMTNGQQCNNYIHRALFYIVVIRGLFKYECKSLHNFRHIYTTTKWYTFLKRIICHL